MNPLTQKPRQSIRKMHFGVRLGAIPKVWNYRLKVPIRETISSRA